MRHGGYSGLSACICGLSLIVGGCGYDPRDEEQTPVPTGASMGGTGDSGSTDSAEGAEGTGFASTGEGESDGGLILDVAPGMGSGDPDDQNGCDKVDFLFVIDNSGSMGDEQDQLIASFPGFIDTIQSTLDEAQDYHIMVIDSDPWVFGECPGYCTQAESCENAQGVCDPSVDPLACFLPCTLLGTCTIGGFQCGVTQPLDECEDVLGAGVNHPRGQDATNADCNFTSGGRYMDTSEPDLHSAFDCAARVGTGSMYSPEKPMEAMVQAVTPGTAAWGCNESFLRDDAILVVTFITDEDDDAGDGSSGTVEGWRSALISAKNGDESAVVVLGLFGDQDQAGAICEPLTENSTSGAEPSPRLRQFVESWNDRGFAGSVCANSYQEFFQQAVDIIDTTCEEFVPPQG